jgi:predicted DNA-binding protein
MCRKTMKQKEKNESAMVRSQFFIMADQAEFLKAQSKRTDRSRAYFVRAAIRLYADKKFGIKLAPEPEE